MKLIFSQMTEQLEVDVIWSFCTHSVVAFNFAINPSFVYAAGYAEFFLRFSTLHFIWTSLSLKLLLCNEYRSIETYTHRYLYAANNATTFEQCCPPRRIWMVDVDGGFFPRYDTLYYVSIWFWFVHSAHAHFARSRVGKLANYFTHTYKVDHTRCQFCFAYPQYLWFHLWGSDCVYIALIQPMTRCEKHMIGRFKYDF